MDQKQIKVFIQFYTDRLLKLGLIALADQYVSEAADDFRRGSRLPRVCKERDQLACELSSSKREQLKNSTSG